MARIAQETRWQGVRARESSFHVKELEFLENSGVPRQEVRSLTSPDFSSWISSDHPGPHVTRLSVEDSG
jgi:hypothetical protein